MFESKNYYIGYPVTSKQGKGQRVGHILISSNYLANKTHSFIKLRDPMVALKNTKNKRIGKLEPNERSFIIHNIANNRINREILRKQFSYQKKLEKQFQQIIELEKKR